SPQSGAGPPTHLAFAQASFVVHALPSLHGPEFGACSHPVAEEHESSVQTLWSSQSGGAPPAHTPPAHASIVVQASPSLHGAVLFVWTQAPDIGLQESSVQGFPSSQLVVGPGTHDPLMQLSGVVQALLSEQVTLSSIDPSQSSS